MLARPEAGTLRSPATVRIGPKEKVGRIIKTLMRLRDPDHTQVLLVTLPEMTPVSEAAALQRPAARWHRASRRGDQSKPGR